MYILVFVVRHQPPVAVGSAPGKLVFTNKSCARELRLTTRAKTSGHRFHPRELCAHCCKVRVHLHGQDTGLSPSVSKYFVQGMKSAENSQSGRIARESRQTWRDFSKRESLASRKQEWTQTRLHFMTNSLRAPLCTARACNPVTPASYASVPRRRRRFSFRPAPRVMHQSSTFPCHPPFVPQGGPAPRCCPNPRRYRLPLPP